MIRLSVKPTRRSCSSCGSRDNVTEVQAAARAADPAHLLYVCAFCLIDLFDAAFQTKLRNSVHVTFVQRAGAALRHSQAATERGRT